MCMCVLAEVISLSSSAYSHDSIKYIRFFSRWGLDEIIMKINFDSGLKVF